MRRNTALRSTLILGLLGMAAACSEVGPGPNAPRVVEASCGQCQFEMSGDGCDLAVRIDGKAYWVDGTGLDDHGDAHAADGFCSTVRQARVTGDVANGRFAVKSFELLPAQ